MSKVKSAASAVSVTPGTEQQLSRLLIILQEYTVNLSGMIERATKDPVAREQIRKRGKAIVAAYRKLAQFASQRITWSTDDLLNLELELRLAEFEIALSSYIELM